MCATRKRFVSWKIARLGRQPSIFQTRSSQCGQPASSSQQRLERSGSVLSNVSVSLPLFVLLTLLPPQTHLFPLVLNYHPHAHTSQWVSRTVTLRRAPVFSRPDAPSATPSVLVSPTRVGNPTRSILPRTATDAATFCVGPQPLRYYICP